MPQLPSMPGCPSLTHVLAIVHRYSKIQHSTESENSQCENKKTRNNAYVLCAWVLFGQKGG